MLGWTPWRGLALGEEFSQSIPWGAERQKQAKEAGALPSDGCFQSRSSYYYI